MKAVIDGAMAGVAATTAMSGPMLLAGRMGWMEQQPPERITEEALSAAGAPVESDAAQDALATVAHYGFGAAAGAVFATLHRRVRLPVPAVAQGMAFGLLVWATSYKGWLPALGIMPPSQRDRPGRRRTMVLGHLVYGAVLGAAEARQRDGARRSR